MRCNISVREMYAIGAALDSLSDAVQQSDAKDSAYKKDLETLKFLMRRLQRLKNKKELNDYQEPR